MNELEALQRAGFDAPQQARESMAGRTAVVHDPDGRTLRLSEPTAAGPEADP